MRVGLICFILFPLLLIAQQQQPYERMRDIHPVGVADSSVYILSTAEKNWEMQVYSTREFQWKQTIPLNAREGKHQRQLEAVFMLDSLPAYVTSYADMSRNLRVVELFRVDKGSVLPAVHLGDLSMKSIPGDPSAARSLEVEWCIAPNGKYVAFSLQNQEDMSAAANRFVTVYDSQLQVFSRSKMVVQSPGSVSKTEYRLEDQLRLLNSGLLVQKTVNKVIFFGNETMFDVGLPELSDNYDVCELLNGTIVVCGLSINREGGFVQSISARDKSRVITMEFDYPDAAFFRLREVIPQNDGTILLVAEEMRYDKTTGYTRTYRTTTGKTTVRHAPSRLHIEVGATRLTCKAVLGKELWSKEILGSESVSENKQGVRITNSASQTSVYGNFTDESGVKAAVMRINSAGETQLMELFPLEKETLVMPGNSVVLNKGCILFTDNFFTYAE